MVEATQTVSVTTLQQLLSNSSSRTSTTMRTDISSGSVHVEGTGVRPPSKKACRNGPSCPHLLKGICAYVHSEEDIAAAEAARQRMFNSSLYLRTKQQYCEYVRDFLWRNDVTSRGKAWLLTCVGVSCPKPEGFPKLRAVLAACVYFEVVPDEANPLVQHVYLSLMGQSTAVGQRGQDRAAESAEGGPSSEGVGERKEPDDADGTLERVRSLLNSLAAVSQSTALPLQLVAVAVDMTEGVLARVLCPHNEEIGVAAGQVWLRNKDEDSENAPPTAATGPPGARPSPLASPSPKGHTLPTWSPNFKSEKMAFQARIVEQLRRIEAYSPETAMPFTGLGAAVPRTANLPPLLRCLEELPDVFAIEQLPNHPSAKAVWLRHRPPGTSTPPPPPTPPAPTTTSPAREKRKSPPKRKPSQDPTEAPVISGSGPDDVDDTSEGFVASVVDFLTSRGAVGQPRALPLSVVEQECPKPMLLPRSSVAMVLCKCPDRLGMLLDQATEPPSWRIWAVDTTLKPPSANKPATEPSTVKPPPSNKPATESTVKPPSPTKPVIEPITPKFTPPARASSLPVPATKPTPAFSTDKPKPSSTFPLTPPVAAYIESVMAYLISVSAFTRDAAVPLKILGEAVPKPPCMLKIRPVLEDCPLFKIQQDPKHLPVQWVWLAVPSSPSTSTPPVATVPVPKPYPTTPKATGGAGGGVPSSFKPRPGLSKSGSSTSYPYTPPPSTPSLSTSGSSAMPAMAERERYAVTGVLSVRDMFHANPKERAYLAGIQRLRSDLEKLKEAGVLQVSLSKSVEADILEFLGDAVLRGALTRKLVDISGSFFGPAGLHQARMASEQRHTLAKLFDDMDLRSLMIDCPADLSDDEWKPKGDVVESILGELDSKLNNASGVPEGHPLRGLCLSVIDKVATAAIDVGQYLKHQNERRRLLAEAKKKAP